MGKKKDIYYIVQAITKDGEKKYVRFNPEIFNIYGEEIENSRKKRFCLGTRACAEPFEKKEYLTKKDGKDFKENIKEKGDIISLKIIEVTEEVVVKTSYKDIDETIWEKVDK